MNAHPLTKMIELYCAQYPELRENNLDVSSLSFHKRFGLAIQVPFGWNVLNSLSHILGERHIVADLRGERVESKIVIIFGSTTGYRKIHSVLGEDVEYFSWHEIFTGMHVAATDVRYIQRARALLDAANLTLFIDPPPLPEVLDQVRGQVSGALIVITGAGTNE